MNNVRWLWCCLLFAPAVRADDWPTYMHDNARSGVTSATVALPLSEQWVYRSAATPKPAWPPPQAGWTELPKVDFDDAFYTVADRDTVYFGSSVDHQVHALDAATGRSRWAFFTNGPVRLTPTLAKDRCYFGSDDGNIYCVKNSDGSLVWSYSPAPNTRQVFGNGQAISLWPARSGVLVEGERTYVSAGVFPYHRVFMAALNVDNGKVDWKSDALSAYGGFSPQGYMLASSGGLIVPSGRASPICIDRADGKLVYEVPRPQGEKGASAGSYGVLVDDTLFVGTQNTLYGFNGKTGANAGRFFSAERLVATPESYFLLKGPPPPAYGRKPISAAANDIVCIDRPTYKALVKKDADTVKKAARWRFGGHDLATLIVAGKHVIAGGLDEVIALDIATGKEVWSAKVDGLVVGLTVAHGRLIASTTKGTIHCFGNNKSVPTPIVAPAWPKEPSAEATESLARGILRESNLKQGHVLVTGPGSARLACELAKQSELNITCIEFDAAQVAAARKNVAALNLYGSRVSIRSGAPEQLPYPDYGANLFVQLDGSNQPAAKEILRVLKPCGGVFMTANWSGPPKDLSAETTTALKGAGSLSTVAETRWLKLVRGELKGSGWWTHQYADAGNSGSSGDQRIKGRLDVLWFGEPGADEFPDRHQRGAAPLVANGRVYCQGWNFLKKQSTVFCFDAYNGVRYWTREIDGAIRLNLPTVSGNLACTNDGVLIAAGPKCHYLDGQTGKTRVVFETPSDMKGSQPDWAYLAVADGLVIGSAAIEGKTRFSDGLFAFDLATGKQKWLVRAKEIRDTTIALNGGRLFYAENRKDPATPAKKLLNLNDAAYSRSIVALDVVKGEQVWEKEVDLKHCGSWDQGVWGSLQMLCKDDVLVLAGAYTIYAGSKATEEKPRHGVALSTKDGKLLWSASIANRSRPVIMNGSLLAEPLFVDLTTGKTIMKQQGTKLVAKSMGPRTGGCGSLSASECMVFGRGGYTVWRDVSGGPSGTFVGVRPGCFINIIPAGGVVVQAEASSGCSCYQAVQCTVVFRPGLGE